MNSCMGEAVNGDHNFADLFPALQNAMGLGNVFKTGRFERWQVSASRPPALEPLLAR
jgi:hypothetical protein